MGTKKFSQGPILHCHTECSVNDGTMTPRRLVERAVELGATAVALTDHGILTGAFDFVAACEDEGIMPIVGMEAYFTPDTESSAKHHLILMAKDNIGFKALSKAVRDSYENTINGFPRMTYEILEKWFGPKAEGHDHIIATSACMTGVLASILSKNDALTLEAEKLRKKASKYQAFDEPFIEMLHDDDLRAQEIDEMIKRRDELTAITKTSTSGLIRRLKTLAEDSEEYTSVKETLNKLTADKDAATKELTKLKADIAAKKKARTEAGKELKKAKESLEKRQALEKRADEIDAQGESQKSLLSETETAAKKFVAIFGEGNFFVELQNHGITREKEVMPVLADLAVRLGIPVCAANDAHYATGSPEDVWRRTLIAATRFNQLITDETTSAEGYGELYMKSDDELYDALIKILPEEIAEKAILNNATIAEACQFFEFAKENHYPKFKGGLEGETPEIRLRRLSEEGIKKRFPSSWDSEKQARMDYELSVINSMGFADYLCIVQDYLDYGRSLAADYPEGVGYTIGPGRGSAAGSLVCYLVGITDIDPLENGLLFERFLNPARVSMPDIDADFSPDIRNKVIEYVKSKYGENAVCAIITKGTFAAKGAIKAVGRVTDVPVGLVNACSDMIPSVPNATIKDCEPLTEFCKTNTLAKELVDSAKLIEGVTVNYGMHAAGIIISDNSDVTDYVPVHWNAEKEQWVAQCDMVQTEGVCRLLKMDFLGLKNLAIITDCMRAVYRNHGVVIDMNHIPQESAVYSSIFAKGRTNAVFQFESGGMKKTLRSFKPTCFGDIVLLNAAYRPGPMQYIEAITEVKHGRRQPEYIANGLEEILSPTYGYPIFQEQVMQIFNKIAGFSLGESDIIRRAMAKKKLYILTDEKTDYYGKFIRGLIANGATPAAAEKFWNELLDFANYAFNKSHSAAYADIAYKTAWLKYHYPAEYMAAVMSQSSYDDLPHFLEDCHTMGVRVLPPDINRSGIDFTADNGSILFGLNNIKGMGSSGNIIVEERKNGPFVSMKDAILRLKNLKKSAYDVLIRVGAFDAFCAGNRASLLNGIDEFIDTVKKLREKEAKLTLLTEEFEAYSGTADSNKDKKRVLRSIETCKKSITKLQSVLSTSTFSPIEDNIDTKLADELELLGFYVSGNPIDKYKDCIDQLRGITQLADIVGEGSFTICGIVKSIVKRNRKKDGAEFAVLTVFDKSKTVEIACWCEEWTALKESIEENKAYSMNIRTKLTEYNGEKELKFSLKKARSLIIVKKTILVMHGTSIVDWIDNEEKIAKYKDDSGCELRFQDSSTGELRKAAYRVSEDILYDSFIKVPISKL